MKRYGYVFVAICIIGLFGLLNTHIYPVFQYMDLTHMEPKKNGAYTSFSECVFYCRHETGINRVEFSIWRTGEPATQVLLEFTGMDGSGEYYEIPAPNSFSITTKLTKPVGPNTVIFTLMVAVGFLGTLYAYVSDETKRK